MPQLDINTFIIQYVSLIILLVSVHTLLSYIVLPLTLRSIVLRSKMLLQDNSTFSLNGSEYKANLSLLVMVNTLKLLATSKDTTPLQESIINKASTTALILSTSYLNYLLLLNTIENDMLND